MEVKRNEYLQKLISRKENGMIKVITGIRRCGKSYLLFNIFKNYLINNGVMMDHIIELSLDDIRNRDYRKPEALYNFVKNKVVDSAMYYILLDEVQFVENFEEVLNSFLHIKNLDTYVTGSNAKFLSKDIITEFRGRGDEIKVYPLSFKEFVSVFEGTKESAFHEYMYYGGLPQIVLMSTHEQKSSYLLNLFKETYMKDIIDRNKIAETSQLDELINIISSSIGSLINPNKLSNTFKSIEKSTISPQTISKYINYLGDSFLLEKCDRYDVKGKRYINTPYKLYFTDTGLRNARINFRQVEESHLMENVIYNELKIKGYSVDVGVISVNENNNLLSTSRKQLEIDFVCNKGSKRIYVQSSLSLPTEEKLVQEIRPLNKIFDSFPKIVVVGDPIISHYNDDGILFINIYDFLLNDNQF